MALNIARGYGTASSRDPESWKSLVQAATGSELLGDIAKYNAEKAIQRAKTEAEARAAARAR